MFSVLYWKNKHRGFSFISDLNQKSGGGVKMIRIFFAFLYNRTLINWTEMNITLGV